MHTEEPAILTSSCLWESPMDAAARVTSKGQVTVPKSVRDALGIHEGDEIVFRVEGNRAVLALDSGLCPSPALLPCLPPNATSPGMT